MRVTGGLHYSVRSNIKANSSSLAQMAHSLIYSVFQLVYISNDNSSLFWMLHKMSHSKVLLLVSGVTKQVRELLV